LSLFLGIDAGTTSMKAAVFDTSGGLLGMDRQEYALLMPAPAIVELDPETYWQACCRAVRGALLQSGADPAQVQTVCISSQGETIILLDAAGRPTRNAIVWLDLRRFNWFKFKNELEIEERLIPTLPLNFNDVR